MVVTQKSGMLLPTCWQVLACVRACQVMMQHYTELKILKSTLYLERKLKEADSSIFYNPALWERKGRKYCQETAQSISWGF